MQIAVKRWIAQIEIVPTVEDDGGPDLHKIALIAVLKNPFNLTEYQADLTEGIEASRSLGEAMATQLAKYVDLSSIQSYGKAGLVGASGEQEHANALLTTTFATPLREAIGGAKAWIPSVTKVGPPSGTIDIPLAHKDALYVRSHYDAMAVSVSGAPLPDEIALIFAVANRGRILARVGGLDAKDVVGEDGLS